MNGDMVCVVCPTSCLIHAEWNETELIRIDNNQCKLAWDYIQGEIFDPRRVVTTTIEVKGGDIPLVSVKTDKPVPKDLVMDVMDSLANESTEAPLNVGDVIVSDVLGTGSNIVATRKVVKTA